MPNALLIIPHLYESPTRDELVRQLQSIAECNFQVRVLTTYEDGREPLQIHKNVEVLLPFKRWNIFELGAVVRATYGYRPDVVHFVFNPSVNIGKSVPLALPGILQNFGNPKFVLQIQKALNLSASVTFRYWMQLSKTVLVEDDFTKLQISSMGESHRKQTFHVLHSGWHGALDNVEPHWISSCFEKYVYSCGMVKSLAQLEDSLISLKSFLNQSPTHGAVYFLHPDLYTYKNSPELNQLISKLDLQKQVILLKSMDPDSNKQLMKNCFLASITHLPVGAPEISSTLKMAHEAGKKIVAHPAVLEFEKSLSMYMANAIAPEKVQHLNFSEVTNPPDNHDFLGLDSIGNQISRIYQELISS